MTEANKPAAKEQKKSTPLKIRVAFCAFWLVCYFAFLIWIRCWWGIIFAPLIFDAYITKKIKWGWWKNIKNKNKRTLMSWIDAIVFALVAAYFVNNYFFQNYVIPSSSLEKSLLTGDYLFVSKMSYGPRKPITPLSMPLVANEMPITGSKSYIEWPQWKYDRVKGLGNVKLNDIVVFNYPSGDTVATAQSQQDFYSMCYQAGQELYPIENLDSLPWQEQMNEFAKQYSYGRSYIVGHPEEFGKVISRPIDHRENYVKRCVGLPGQTLQIKNKIVYLDGKPNKEPDNVQYGYVVTFKANLPDEIIRSLGITQEDLGEASPYNPATRYMPLTKKALSVLRSRPDIVASITEEPPFNRNLYPLDMAKNWTVHNYGPIWIPKRGATIQLNKDNYAIYERPIRVYENNSLELRDGNIYINGKQTNSYTFKLNYYWMMGDNRDRSADSRFWGFVPEDHIVGKPILVWFSLDKDRGLFDGKIRWNRLFRWVDNIK